MPAPPAHSVRPLKQSADQSVWLVQRPHQQPRTVKRWDLTPWRLVKLGLGISQAQRQVRGSRRLARAGLRTPDLAGGWRLAWRGRPVVELELAWIEGRSAVDLARDGTMTPERLGPIAATLGRMVAAMAAAGLFNRDMKLANLIVDARGEVWQIDTVGVRRGRRRVRETARMIERLGVQLPLTGPPHAPAVWLPVLRHALRGLGRESRREAVRWLRAHRPRRSG